MPQEFLAIPRVGEWVVSASGRVLVCQSIPNLPLWLKRFAKKSAELSTRGCIGGNS